MTIRYPNKRLVYFSMPKKYSKTYVIVKRFAAKNPIETIIPENPVIILALTPYKLSIISPTDIAFLNLWIFVAIKYPVRIWVKELLRHTTKKGIPIEYIFSITPTNELPPYHVAAMVAVRTGTE